MRSAIIVLVLHWGGFVGGSPALMAPHSAALEQRGVRVVTPSYPLGNPLRAERSMIALARRYHRRHKVIAYGTSAGATIALRLRALGAVDAAVAVSPVVDVANWEQRDFIPPWSLDSAINASPSRLPCGKRSPALIVHAVDDGLVPWMPSADYAERCHARFELRQSGGHGIIVGPLRESVRFTRKFITSTRRTSNDHHRHGKRRGA